MGPKEENVTEQGMTYKIIRVGHPWWTPKRAANTLGADLGGDDASKIYDEAVAFVEDGCPISIWPGGEEASHQSMMTMGEMLDEEWWYEWR